MQYAYAVMQWIEVGALKGPVPVKFYYKMRQGRTDATAIFRLREDGGTPRAHYVLLIKEMRKDRRLSGGTVS